MRHPNILKLDISGRPVEWLSWQSAATLYCCEKVAWEAGDTRVRVFGGVNVLGARSFLDLSTIVAVPDMAPAVLNDCVPPLTRLELYRRDRGRCLYCGDALRYREMQFEHIIPRSRGGAHAWTNVVSACGPCNLFKGNQTPQEAGMSLLALPFEPNRAQWLLLANRHVLADQQRFLEAMAPRRPNTLAG